MSDTRSDDKQPDATRENVQTVDGPTQLWSTSSEHPSSQTPYSTVGDENVCDHTDFQVQAAGDSEEGARSTVLPRLGRYVLLEQLGRGGMGEVYRALHERLHKQVALKLLPPHRAADPQAHARFQQEIRLISKLSHPNIVRLENAGEMNGQPFLVMEYVPGIDLRRLVTRLGPLRPADACQLVGQAALGLAHLEEHGLVHRDIKPSNLLLSAASGAVKITDLGIARLAEGHSELTAEGESVGDPHYMAPEQIEDTAAVDIRADIYALGCTLYSLLTGKRPFEDAGPGVAEVLDAHLNRPLPRLSDLGQQPPAGLQRAIDQMTARQPAQRMARPLDVAAAMARLAVGCDLSELLREAELERPKETVSTDTSIHSAEYLALHTHVTANAKARRVWMLRTLVAVVAIVVLAPLGMLSRELLRSRAALDGTFAAESADDGNLAGDEKAVAVGWEVAPEFDDEPGGSTGAGVRTDLLEVIDAERDAIGAEAIASFGELHILCPRGRGMVQAPIVLRGDYQVAATIERTAGEDSFAIGFSVGDARLLALVDHKQGDHWMSGLAHVDANGKVVLIGSHEGRLLWNETPIELRLEVTPNRVVMKVSDPQGMADATTSPTAWITRTWIGNPANPSLTPFDACYPGILFVHAYRSSFRLSKLCVEARQNVQGVSLVSFAGDDAMTERRIAELLLWRGGEVEVLGEAAGAETQMITARSLEDLPPQPWIVSIDRRDDSPRLALHDRHLEMLHACPDLERLDLRGCIASSEGLAALNGLPRLEFLALGGESFSGETLEALRNLPALRRLMLNNLPITDDDLAILERFRELTLICLSQCPITDRGVIEFIPSLTKLQHLCLNYTQIDGECLSSLTPLGDLRELQLADTGVTDGQLKIVDELPSLKELVLTDAQVTGEAVARIRAQYPQLEVRR